MRIPAAVLLVLVATPLCLDAQRLPGRAGRTRPDTPAELPPAAPPVERALAYRRARLAVETYPLVQIVQAPIFGTDGLWTAFGAGTHVEYRLTRTMLGALELTSSNAMGPARVSSLEAGARFMEDRYESRTRPFADVRLSWMGTTDHTFSDPTEPDLPGAGSSGFGGVVGGGLHHDLSPDWSLTTTGTVSHGWLRSVGLAGDSRRFGLTTYRLSLGLRYNRTRQILAAQPR